MSTQKVVSSKKVGRGVGDVDVLVLLTSNVEIFDS